MGIFMVVSNNKQLRLLILFSFMTALAAVALSTFVAPAHADDATAASQYVVDGTMYVDDVPANGIPVTAILNGVSKSDISGSGGQAGYFRIAFEPVAGPISLSYTYNGETMTVPMIDADPASGGSRCDFYLSSGVPEENISSFDEYVVGGQVRLDGTPVNGATVSTEYGGGASNVTFAAPGYGDGMYLLLLQKGSGSAVVTVTCGGITSSLTIASPNQSEGGYDMLDFDLTTPGASPSAGPGSTHVPTLSPGDISGKTDDGNASVTPSPTSPPAGSPGVVSTPSVLLGIPGTFAVLALIGRLMRKTR
jgi:hypothetical protein